MAWRSKAAVQKVLSAVPGGARINFELQRRTGGLPLSDAKLLESRALCEHHRRVLEKHGDVELRSGAFYEFGAGWDMHIPLLLASLGAGPQVVVDIRRLLRADLACDIARRLHDLEPSPDPWDPPPPLGDLEDLLTGARIRYVAPLDARCTGFPAASFDYVTSTNTMEHIPPDDIERILRECRRILRPGGVMSFQIDYQDHYSYFDRSISVYNFLRYDDRTWRWINSGLHYQNRLRHRDHTEIIERSGFEIVDAEVTTGSTHDLEELERLDLASRFEDYSLEELAIRGSRLVIRRTE
jgi:SAM-dependent methyltransferase